MQNMSSNKTLIHNFTGMTIMEQMGIDELLSKAVRAENQKLCPECGAKMNELERACESGTIFVWYGCSKNTCNGQWLQKVSQQSLKLNISDRFSHATRLYQERYTGI